MKPTRPTGPKLGELLEARGRLDREALFRAIRHQRASGGRIGTCLLELDLVTEDELLHLLSEQSKLPFVEEDALRSVAEETIKLVPAKVARARRAIPVRASGSQLYVAMIDPHDIAAQDELSFVSGRRVRPQVASEVRIYEALARYYGIEIPGRFVKLLDRLNRARYLWKEEAPAGASPPARPAFHSTPPPAPELRPAPPRPPALSPLPSFPPLAIASAPPAAPPPAPPAPPAGVVASAAPTPAPAVAETEASPVPPAPPATLDAPLVAPPAATPPAPAEPPPVAAAPAPLSVEQAEARLMQPDSRETVADVLIGLAAARGEAALLLVVRKDEASGWRGAVPGRDESAIRAFRMSLAEPSVLLALREGVPYYRGPLPPLRSHRPLAELLGPAAGGEILAVPLHVRQRLVGVLMVAGGATPLDGEAIEDLRSVAGRASVALEMLVLRQKLQHT